MSGRGEVIFATYRAQPATTDDDRLLADALRRHGVIVRAVPWDDPAMHWHDARAVIVRSTWDYHLRREEFLAWTARVGAATSLFNSPGVIRWNSHKGYLAALAARGVPVIDTVFVDTGAWLDVAALALERGWEDVVIKPAVSASAHETRHFGAADRVAAQVHLDRLAENGDVMMQPHLRTLADRGELSVMLAHGEVTHAVRRRSALASYHTMPKSAPAAASTGAVQLAERVVAEAALLSGAAQTPLYARVDLAEEPGKLLLLELELIEPSLFFAHAPQAAERMAAAVRGALAP